MKFTVTLGAGIGLMSISVLIADFVLLHFTDKRKFFQKVKELKATDFEQTEEFSNGKAEKSETSLIYIARLWESFPWLILNEKIPDDIIQDRHLLNWKNKNTEYSKFEK